LRITSGPAAGRTYVLGNGSAFGVDTPPGPVGCAESFAAVVAGVGAWDDLAGLHAAAVIAAAISK
ncbi:MAG TPA: hypothetical protein VGC52_07840, partial [Gemmatimonadaceae bacterium]